MHRIGLPALLLLLLPACSIDWEAANRIQIGVTTGEQVIRLMGEPDSVERYVERDVYLYTDALPAWPLVLPWVFIVYGLVYYNWDPNELYVVLRNDVVIDRYARGPDAWRLERRPSPARGDRGRGEE